MDLFDDRSASPMLLIETSPFDSENHIFELKLDGIRSLAYIDKNLTELRNKRNKILNDVYPELNKIHLSVKDKCILDGELIVLKDGRPDFFEVQKRSLMTDKFRIKLSSENHPVVFLAYDILYHKNKSLLDISLLERKKILKRIVKESKFIAISRYIEDLGIDFYNIIAEQDLEGVVAKRKDSVYQMGKRSKHWVKFKAMKDTEFIIVGYTPNETYGIKSVSLGILDKGELMYQGQVAMGIPKNEQILILDYAKKHVRKCPFDNIIKSEDIIWIDSKFICTVKYMMRTKTGALRQPVYKGLRNDKTIKEITTEQFDQ